MNPLPSVVTLLRTVADAPCNRETGKRYAIMVRETATPYCGMLFAKRRVRANGARETTVRAAEKAGYITVTHYRSSDTRAGFASYGTQTYAEITPAGLAALEGAK